MVLKGRYFPYSIATRPIALVRTKLVYSKQKERGKGRDAGT